MPGGDCPRVTSGWGAGAGQRQAFCGLLPWKVPCWPRARVLGAPSLAGVARPCLVTRRGCPRPFSLPCGAWWSHVGASGCLVGRVRVPATMPPHPAHTHGRPPHSSALAGLEPCSLVPKDTALLVPTPCRTLASGSVLSVSPWPLQSAPPHLPGPLLFPTGLRCPLLAAAPHPARLQAGPGQVSACCAWHRSLGAPAPTTRVPGLEVGGTWRSCP